jgi:hypothetical protein
MAAQLGFISPDGKTAMFLKWKLDCHKTPVASELYLTGKPFFLKLSLFKISGLARAGMLEQ